MNYNPNGKDITEPGVPYFAIDPQEEIVDTTKYYKVLIYLVNNEENNIYYKNGFIFFNCLVMMLRYEQFLDVYLL